MGGAYFISRTPGCAYNFFAATAGGVHIGVNDEIRTHPRAKPNGLLDYLKYTPGTRYLVYDIMYIYFV